MVKIYNLYWRIKFEWGHWPPLGMCWIRPWVSCQGCDKASSVVQSHCVMLRFLSRRFLLCFLFLLRPRLEHRPPFFSAFRTGFSKSEKPVLNPKRRGHRIGKIQEHVICRNWMICSIDYYGMEFYNKVVWMPRMNFVGKYFSKERKEERKRHMLYRSSQRKWKHEVWANVLNPPKHEGKKTFI